MSDCLDCPVYVRGLAVPGADGGPTILARTDANFIQALLDDLTAPDGLTLITGSTAQVPKDEDYLKLFPPVQRTFNLAVLESGCDVLGQPRLDPSRIESAGLVVRRVHEDPDLLVRPAIRSKNRMLAAQGASQAPRALAQDAAESLRTFLEQATNTVSVRADTVRSAAERATFVTSRRYEAWAQMGAQLQGWVPLTDSELDDDPDPERRRPLLRSGSAFLDELLAASGQQPRAEAISPLFAAPPDVCGAAGKTVLYGLIPVTSAEISEQPEVMPAFPQAAVIAHLAPFLTTDRTLTVPRPGQLVNYTAGKATDMAAFVTLLRQLAIELDAFGTTAAARALYARLNQIKLSFTFTALTPSSPIAGAFRDLVLIHVSGTPEVNKPVTVQIPAGDYLKLAVPVLVERQGEAPGDSAPVVFMPDQWPSLDAQQRQGIITAVTAVLQTRLAGLATKSGRYDELNRLYIVRAFVRVRGKEGCPPTLIWSEPSRPFHIAAWYESGDAPPTQVRLPDVSDRNFLKKIKPNVAFVMPEGLFNMLNRSDPKALQAGTADTSGPSIGLQWICSFSIPIITICAFIVLYIFLTLFDLIFRWLMFVKICIPFPKKG